MINEKNNMKNIGNVIGVFDGSSGGQIALERSGIGYDNYFASEIDKHAIKVTQANYPNTIQLGDVTKISGDNLPKINLLLGGSPCQGFSIAGKGLNFEDPRSKLFFEFVRLKNEIQPKYFLLENVVMKKKEWEKIISEYLGVEPILINSNLVSAQNRKRLYWTNIPNIFQPKDKFVELKDILEDNIAGMKIMFDNGECIFNAKNGKNIRLNNKIDLPYTIYEARTEFGKMERKRLRNLYGIDTTPRNKEHKEYLPLRSNKANCILTIETPLDYILDKNLNFRTYTINELERLQTLPENYFNVELTKNQIRKMIGNGWTIDVIVHILKNIPI